MLSLALASVDESYAAVATSVPEARRSLARWLRALPEDDLMIADIELAVSEACTNAVVHGYVDRAAGAFRVRGENAGGAIIVTVSDDGDGMTPRPASPGLGLGLPLMATLADRLDVRAPLEGSGTVVRMHFRARP